MDMKTKYAMMTCNVCKNVVDLTNTGLCITCQGQYKQKPVDQDEEYVLYDSDPLEDTVTLEDKAAPSIIDKKEQEKLLKHFYKKKNELLKKYQQKVKER